MRDKLTCEARVTPHPSSKKANENMTMIAIHDQVSLGGLGGKLKVYNAGRGLPISFCYGKEFDFSGAYLIYYPGISRRNLDLLEPSKEKC